MVFNVSVPLLDEQDEETDDTDDTDDDDGVIKFKLMLPCNPLTFDVTSSLFSSPPPLKLDLDDFLLSAFTFSFVFNNVSLLFVTNKGDSSTGLIKERATPLSDDDDSC